MRFFLAAVLITLTASAKAEEKDYFHISLSDINDSHVLVNAEITVKNGRLFTGSGGSYDWKRGWADFIQDVTARSTNGETLNISQQGEGFESYWYLAENDGPFNGKANVSYKVDLVYARTDWDFGNEQAGRIYNNALYSVTKPLFLSTGGNRETEIIFDIPDRWKIASPWKQISKNIYITGNWEELDKNAITIGLFESVSGSAEGFDLEIVLMGDFPSAPPLVTETIDQVLPVYLDIFPETKPEKYLMFYLNGPSEDAEAFRNGAAFTTSLALSSDNRIFWADFLAHELFHFWNGTRIRAKERWQGNWFSEGFTDYYANLVLVNRGVLSEDWFIRRMENIFGNYLYFHHSGLFEGLSVLEAGKEKGRNRFGVYDAGWVLAFALDDKIRTETEGKKSLDDVMKLAFERFGQTGENYALDELLDVMSEATDINLAPFFEKYLKSREELPLVKLLQTFGLESYSNAYANEYYISQNVNAENTAKTRWENLIYNRFSD